MPSHLFSPITLGALELPNRMVVAPMCQYSAEAGTMTDWHLMHLGQFAVSGAGLVIVEATGVEPEGRITPGCTGLWSDENEAAMARVVRFFRDYGAARIGIQLGHAGRKASANLPWKGGAALQDGEGAWQTIAPSAIAVAPGWPVPEAMTGETLARVRAAFVQAARRAERAGFDLIELHAAHGYLLHTFLSPLTNLREDGYGGSLPNRLRFPLEVFDAVREVWPAGKPLGVRFSATDWIEGGWDLESSVAFAEALKARGCDFVDVSSGGLSPAQKITASFGYQTGFAAEVRRATGLPTIAVGRITDPVQAETILATGQADMVALARGALYDPRWAWHAAERLGDQAAFPAQYLRAHPTLQGIPVPGNPPVAKSG
ncbi:NADH:flavin oxidoreductase/NADH oxidase [Limibaculum sp. FT325]|uniref:NADH:flavin oxidoreductase/NADH oxidase n=1 Tax=Thermohalobaculum sediminis TaxID=2939436 RepID=UPI0020BD6065|nr:NADH:flavin oxidoreductase/NADH oxidase [Limibaculum sediminis]MCL5776948.1 NADH:flavin oxidoreductase/NADH oxidase [Limibaculum sediminis]